MDKLKAIAVLKVAYRAGCRSVKFNLRGEPLLYRWLPDLISEAKKIGYIETMINTNGAFPFSVLDQAISAGLDRMIISVDSLDRETYKALHGATDDQFYNMYNNITIASNKTKVEVNFHENMINHVDKNNFLFDLFRRKGIKINFRKTMKREGRDLSFVEKRKRKWLCPHIFRRVTVLSNFKVYPCCLCYNEPKDICIGDLLKTNVWGTIGKRIRLILAHVFMKYPKSCIECGSAEVWRR